MDTEKNKALSLRFFEAFNHQDLDAADRFAAPDYVTHDPATPGLPHGPDAVKQTIRLYRTAFPDARLTVEEVIADGDRVVTRWTARGTHRGELMGIPPTGRPVAVTGITIDRIEGDRVVESWVNWDALGLLQQIGVVPSLAHAAAV